jgi:ribosomal protein S20
MLSKSKSGEDEQQKQPRKLRKHLMVAAMLVVGLHGFAFVLGNSSLSAQEEAFKEDIVATDACVHFRNVYRDIADGVLSDAELRTKTQEVNKTASASEVPEIRTAARTLLSTVTTGTTDQAVAAMGNMLSECDKYAEKVKKAEEAKNAEDENKPEKEKDSDCFIATAAYGTHLTHDLDVLRDFRDNNLKTNAIGGSFVDGYYKVGPVAADFIEDKPLLRDYVREFHIKPMVRVIELFN